VLYTDTVAVELPGGESACVAFRPWTADAGEDAAYTVTVRVALPGDENAENDAAAAEIRT
jgi:hypothetical protein